MYRALALCLAVAGCTTAERVHDTPQGQAVWLVSCGQGTGFGPCLERAAQICPTFQAVDYAREPYQNTVQIECTNESGPD